MRSETEDPKGEARRETDLFKPDDGPGKPDNSRPHRDDGMGEEDLELRRIRLRKMRQLLAARTQTDQQQQPKRGDPVEELKRYLDERGNEVLEEAASLNRALTERVAEALLRAIRSNALPTPIDAGDLLRLFRDLGLPIRLETSVRILRHGEAKDLRKYLSEGV